MVAATTSSPSAGTRSTQRWLPGTMRVAPLASVKSSSAHIVFTTTDGKSGGSGYTDWSRCSTWACSPGPIWMPVGAESW